METTAAPSRGVLKTITAYIRVTKPASVSLLAFTGIVGFAVASRGAFPPTVFLPLLIALALGCAGANALTCYLDKDIDAIMERTQKRPLPTLQISPKGALLFGFILITLALGFSFSLNFLTFTLACVGISNNVLIYCLWTKRRTPLNIFLGSPAGGIPAVAGYAAYANAIDLKSLLLGVLVMVWIPIHIWSLALKYKEDYLKAKIPMLPVVVNKERAVQFIALFSVLLVGISLLSGVLGVFGAIYFWSAIVLGTVLLALTLWLTFKPKETCAWVVFKVSSLYLALLFLSVLVDSSLSV